MQDPYVVVKLGNQTQKTPVCKEGGKTPTWFQNLPFTVTQDANMTFEVYDEDGVSDDHVGTGMINLGPFLGPKKDATCIFVVSKSLFPCNTTAVSWAR